MFGCRKPRHLTANLSENRGGRHLLNAWDTQEQLQSLLKRSKSLVNILLQMLNALLQKGNVGEQGVE